MPSSTPVLTPDGTHVYLYDADINGYWQCPVDYAAVALSRGWTYAAATDGSGGAVAGSTVVLVTGSTSTAAGVNVTAINNAISAANAAGGGIVALSTPGTYYINDHILMRSNINLRISTGVVIKKIAGATNNVCMIRNANPLNARPYGDTNMVIDGGGTIDGNYVNNTTTQAQADTTTATVNTLLYGLMGDVAFLGVSGLRVRDLTIQNCNGSGIQALGDNITIENITFSTGLDGIHLNGPSRGVRLRNISGRTDDDFIAINAWDWHKSSPSAGDIEDLVIENCTFLGVAGLRGTAAGRAIKLLSGTRTTGTGQGTGNIRNVRVSSFSGYDTPGFAIMSDFDAYNGAEYSGAGIVENVTFDTCRMRPGAASDTAFSIYKDANGTPADGQTSLAVRNVVLRNFDVDNAANANSAAFAIKYVYTGLSINGLTIRDTAWTPMTANGGGCLVNVQSKSILDALEVDGVTILGNAINQPVVLVNTYNGSAASEVKTLTLNRVGTATGVTIDGPILTLNGIVDMLYASAWTAAFTGGSSDNHGVFFSNAVAVLKDAVLSNLNLTNPKELFTVKAGATGTLICKATVRDSVLVNCTHPIFITAGRVADIRFRGGNIDTATNLARVDTSTLTLTLDGTTSSGAGGSAITQVSTTTLRVVKADRIALPLNTLTLTETDGDEVYSSATPTSGVSGTGAGRYTYRGGAGFVKLN